ncbi:PP2C family protein-serine/threonine phosphatase [Streptomyces sp. NPDC050509]|uniref:PP2C family protein-serine/threonine phosphatase n=1 Tax=Streptomyces sp. NPDC050509 TaxID=3365620 RepID=UPI0037A8BB2C
MPSPLFADHPVPQPVERETVDALIARTRALRGDMAAVRQDSAVDDDEALRRWRRALCDLAVHQLEDLGVHLDQLRAGRPESLPADGRTENCPAEDGAAPDGRPSPDDPPRGQWRTPPACAMGTATTGTGLHQDPPEGPAPAPGRVGSAEWNLLTDEVNWSAEMYEILGRARERGPMTLDEVPSLVFPDDQALLTGMVTDCLIDGKPIDGELRVVRADGQVRTVHLTGEPVVDADGCTASLWAVLRDVSALRRSERAVRESGRSVQRAQHIAQTEHRLVTELQEAVVPSWRGALRLSQHGPGALELAARHLPSEANPLNGGDWYDALELPGGDTLLTLGDLTGHGVAAASSTAMLLGALRGMAVAGIEPGALLGHLNQLLNITEQPVLGSALCARYQPATGALSWAQAAHPAPLLFRDGTGRALTPPDGVLLGATSGAGYEQAEIRLLPGDVLVLHTDGLTRDGDGTGTQRERLLALAPRMAGNRTAQEWVRAIDEEFGMAGRSDDACVMAARIGGRTR